ncbi:MAG TPA: AAA domain-containing protein, partial [Steroidobacteraceae bacterium]|nr:AAA domain-containing protein [Steroidobacteraceae bacterium]
AAETALAQQTESLARLDRVENEASGLRPQCEQARKDLQQARTALDHARENVKAARGDRDALVALRPGFFARLFATRRYRDWRTRAEAATHQVDAALAVASEATRRHADAERAEKSLRDQLRAIDSECAALTKKSQEKNATIEAGREIAGDSFPDDAFWNLEDAVRQRASPWLGPTLQAARDRLFCDSFALHRAFIDLNARYLRHNLNVAMALLRGHPLDAKQEPCRRSIWSSLFLVVPVISTTFASVARLFGPLGREQLGWLLIDEAGQATPQAAVGAIWRASRVVSIGDPLQIEPVVTTPPRLVTALLKEFGVDSQIWAAPQVSVQVLADRMSWLGTSLRSVAGDVWVGSPLRVHRRCEQPMFAISNQIAYGGMMIYATSEKPSRLGGILGPSAWFSIATNDFQGKWSEAEAAAAMGLLLRVLDAGETEPDLYFISPFRMVATRLAEKIQHHPRIGGALGGNRRKWVRERVGTVHKFQGKEAEAVVLVLGAADPSLGGSRRWAGNSPNLLNVAVSRAQRRLYVVGSRTVWRDAGVFEVLNLSIPDG